MRQAAPRPLAGIEATTSGIKLLLSGFELFPSIVKKILVEKGIVEPGVDGRLLTTQERWFPLESWLAVHEVIYREIGPNAILSLGTRITENPNFPPGIKDIPAALHALDLAYHRSHRKFGVAMYDPATGQMMEGIGNYRMHHLVGRSTAEVTSDTPYLCDVDLSILRGTVQQCDLKAKVVHAQGTCKKNGDAACQFTVTW
jgi:hypothetical protein